MAELKKDKRNRSAAEPDQSIDEYKRLNKRQKKAAATKSPYYTPKPASAIKCIDIPVEQMMPQQRIDLIANLSESILEDPASALTSTRTDIAAASKSQTKKKNGDCNVDGSDAPIKEAQYHKTQSKMNKLLDLASLSTNGHDSHAARLALLSLLAIFQDILPAYRIRLPTEAEMSVRVSKETKQTWDYERKLLQSYQRYLQLLEKTWEDGKFGHRSLLSSMHQDGEQKGKKQQNHRGGPPTTLAATAILSLSQLLQTCYNFNFRSNLLQIIVRQANHRSSEEVRSSCCMALASMFSKDVQGEASLEAVRRMSKMIKDRQQHSSGSGGGGVIVRPELLNTWLSLPLRVHEDEAIAAKLAAQAKAKKAKKSQQEKDIADIEKEMKEGDATVDKMDLAKNQAEILHSITLTYFRVLKMVEHASTEEENINKSTTDLLPAALRGLAKFSHLIHLDAVVDLLAVLKDLLKNAHNLPTDAAIHCILCALKTLRGPGRDTIPVDPKEYLIPLYNVLPRIGVESNESDEGKALNSVASIGSDGRSSNNIYSNKTIEATIQCLDHAFLQRRELSTTRLAGFLKRLTSTALHSQPHSCAPLIACARQVAARYASSASSKVGRMLENEDDVIAEGMYAPEAEDPEHSNAHATSLWELSLLRYHVNPRVADQAMGMAESRLLKLPGEAPVRIWEEMGRDVREVYVAQKMMWKKHPLDTRKGVDEDNIASSGKKRREQRRRQNQTRFITPRRTAKWHLLPPTSFTML